MKIGYVYVMANEHRTTYVGVTSNLMFRVWQHKTGAVEGFTTRYGCKKLEYFQEFRRIDEVIRYERYVKGKTRAWKCHLIAGMNPRWNDLAWNWYDDVVT